MTERVRVTIPCRRCGKDFVSPKYSHRSYCTPCTEIRVEQQRHVYRREVSAVLSPAELELKMRQIVADEIAMPWEKTKK